MVCLAGGRPGALVAPSDRQSLWTAPEERGAFEGALLILDSVRGAEAAKSLGARRVVPAHYDSRAHFKEGRHEIETAFTEAGPADRLGFAR
ncbi:hypothetical protein [Streptomyces bobili]|uniref:hypothetical protein n=1 Tax=Streptomyces bobili TaxID=67280 RepID=UPI003F4D08A7